ncbi:MAG: hypothetical protein H7210_10805 [Pyrinomonadaceae bacterium]|nr:hypothetical protein [Phycisphaerales bacterium]
MDLALEVFAALHENRHAVIGRLGSDADRYTCVVPISGLDVNIDALRKFALAHQDVPERALCLWAELTPEGRVAAAMHRTS